MVGADLYLIAAIIPMGSKQTACGAVTTAGIIIKDKGKAAAAGGINVFADNRGGVGVVGGPHPKC